MSYFDWRKDYWITQEGRGSPHVFCHLCRYMHTDNRPKIMNSFNKWFFEKSECKDPYKEIKFD